MRVYFQNQLYTCSKSILASMPLPWLCKQSIKNTICMEKCKQTDSIFCHSMWRLTLTFPCSGTAFLFTTEIQNCCVMFSPSDICLISVMFSPKGLYRKFKILTRYNMEFLIVFFFSFFSFLYLTKSIHLHTMENSRYNSRWSFCQRMVGIFN